MSLGEVIVDVEEDASATSSSSSSSSNVNKSSTLLLENSFWYTFFISCHASRHIFIINFISIIGYCCTISIVPEVITQRYAVLHHGYDSESHDGNNCSSFDSDNKPQACVDGSNDAQNATAMCSLVTSIITFLFACVIGKQSDTRGRRTFFLMGLLLSIASPIMLVLLQVFHSLHPFWYFAGQSIQGFISWFSIALSSISDVMPPELRAPSFGLVMAAFLLGFSIAPSFPLFMSHFMVSITSVAILIFVFFYALVFFPETLTEDNIRCHQLQQQQQQLQHDVESTETTMKYQKVLRILQRPFTDLSILLRNRFITILAITAVFSTLAASVTYTFLLYYLEQNLDFNDKDISTLFFMNGLSGFFVQTILFRFLNKVLGDRKLLLLSCVFGMIYNLIYSVAQTKFQIYIASVLSAIHVISFPVIASLKSVLVDVTEQGQIQGALASINALSSGFGPLLIRLLYSHTKSTLDATFGAGSIFLFASILYLIGSFFVCALPPINTIQNYQHDRLINKEDNDDIDCCNDHDDVTSLDATTTSSNTSELFEKQHHNVEGHLLYRELA